MNVNNFIAMGFYIKKIRKNTNILIMNQTTKKETIGRYPQ